MARTPRRRCPVYRCQRKMPAHLYVCETHWLEAPVELRRRMWDAYLMADGPRNQRFLEARDAVIDYGSR